MFPTGARLRSTGAMSPPMKSPRWISIATIMLVSQGLSGCAYTYLDESGAKRIVGLVSVTVRPEDVPLRSSAQIVGVKNIGASVIRSKISSSISFGYNSDSIATVYDNSCVFLPPLGSLTDKEK